MHPKNNSHDDQVSNSDGEDIRQVIHILQVLQQEVKELRAEISGRVKPYYTVEEVAEIVGRSAYTVRRWIAEDRIQAIRIDGSGPRGRLLIRQSELTTLMESGLGGKVSPVLVNNTS